MLFIYRLDKSETQCYQAEYIKTIPEQRADSVYIDNDGSSIIVCFLKKVT